MARYDTLMMVRKRAMVMAWCMVLLAFFLLPSVHMEIIAFRPGTEDAGAWAIIFSDFLGIIFTPVDMYTFSVYPLKYYLRILSSISTVISHIYFFSTFLIIFIPPCSHMGRVMRYPALVLLFIWTFPVLNHFHPIGVGVWRLEFGFYVMGAGYMLAMVCILWSPRRPEVGRAFPVVEGGRKVEI